MPDKMPLLLFCANPLHQRLPDDVYLAEVEAAHRAGAPYALVSYEALVDERDAVRAVRLVPEQPTATIGIYRGWMLRPERYALLYEALADRNIILANDPAAYTHCHYLPESYSVIERQTPRTVWIRTGRQVDMNRILALLQVFGNEPIIVKDFVKSRKHEWADACFIPTASDQLTVERVVRRFLELQGDDFCEGLVFRRYVELTPLATHTKSGMPLAVEYRVFVLDGEPIAVTPYWEQGDYNGDAPALDVFRDTMHAVRSRFYTMDFARHRDGGWLILELGDGQVAGLPERADVGAFYATLLTSLTR
jgi:ATP-grasp domain, R2K clade family 3